MLRYILTSLLFVSSLQAAPPKPHPIPPKPQPQPIKPQPPKPHPQPPKPQPPNHKPNPHWNPNYNHSAHYCGKTHKGHDYVHYCYKLTWHGWHHSCWCARLSCICYWSDDQRCWYYIDDDTFVPLDDCTDPDNI